ncbi:acyl carrier protein [Streptomyces sp. LZ34]
MSEDRSREEITARLLTFVRERFLGGDPEGELTSDTPLFEYGVLNSLNTAITAGWIHDTFGIPLSQENITSGTFESVDAISALLCGPAAEKSGDTRQ